MKERTRSTARHPMGLCGRGMLLVLGICLFQGPTLGAAQESSVYTGREAPLIIQQAPSPIPCTGRETVLLIQDVVPWFAPGDQNPLGANVTELAAQEKNFCMINSNEIGTANLGQFGEILISAAQTQTFYNNLFPGGVIHSAIENWVAAGGILSANLTDCASGPGNGGTWATQPCNANAATSYTFVGGVKHVSSFTNDNNIADPSHPIVIDALPCPSGNCALIADLAPLNDLDAWGSSSHGYFINLPLSTTVILNQPDVDGDNIPESVMVEYPFGAGTVIATQSTTEWRYGGDFGSLPQNKKLLANEIAYQDSLVSQIDHFKCYESEGDSPKKTVNLEDQFGTEPQVEVKKPKFFCNPVSKNGEKIKNPDVHLTCYEIKVSEKEREVLIRNQFGEQTLEVEESKLLCVPSKKIHVVDDKNDHRNKGIR